MATHEGHAGRMEGKGREGNDAVGSGLHVLLWVPESRAPEGVKFDGKAHLSWKDVQLEDASSPKWIRVRIKESKTDRMRVGAFVTLQRTDLDICPVKAVLEFMAVTPGPFFTGQDGVGLTRRDFVVEVRKALVEKGIPEAGISGQFPDWSSHGSSCMWSLRGRGESIGEMEE